MAIVSKAVFEKAAGKSPALGTALGLDRYASANRGLAALTGGGRLFLVTVRPPDEALWLVAVLDDPSFKKEAWVAKASAVPLTDLSALKTKLTFENGKGLPTTAGTLGMSLQTPRVLTAADVALLDAALGGASAGAKGAAGAKASASADPAAAAADAARGELVELELELSGRLSRHRGLALRARKAQLIEAHGARWWPWKVQSRRQRAGFLSAVSVTASAAGLAALAKLLEVEPVTELELLEIDEDSLGKVARAPWLARITKLILRGAAGEEGLAALAKSKHVAGLQALTLSSNELPGEALEGLGKQLPALRHLVLTNNPIGDEGAAALAAWSHLNQLRSLYLTACELSAKGLTSLLAGGQLVRLEKWTLSQNELGDAGASAILAHAPQLARLSFLELREIGLRDAGAKALAEAALPALRRLDISGNRGSSAALTAAYGDAVRR